MLTASRTSLRARSTGVPISNSTEVKEPPSDARELMVRTPDTPRTAPSTFCVICVSISGGAAPGWDTWTMMRGNEISGLRLIGKRMKLTIPSTVSTTKATIGSVGLRIAHADMFFMARPGPAHPRADKALP